MKKILTSIFALFTIISFSSCEKISETKTEVKAQKNEIIQVKTNKEPKKIEAKIEAKKERVKSQEEIDHPEWFNPTTGESIQKPL